MYSIFVNSTDKYSDCWYPFFYLFKKNYGDIKNNLYLNCEKESFSFDGLPIKIIRNSINFTWSQCLINAIDKIDTRIILYLQDDYFLNMPVNLDTIEDFVKIMLNNPDIKHIGLTKFGSRSSLIKYNNDERLEIIDSKANYRISLQAALWDKNNLLTYLEPDENAWMLELFGSRRARKRNDLFLTVSPSYYRNKSIINYIHTGIIKGKWHKDIPDFFKKEGIYIDFSKRGITDPYKYRIFNKLQTIFKIASNPSKLKYFLK